MRRVPFSAGAAMLCVRALQTLVLAVLACAVVRASDPQGEPAAAPKVRIVLVGDSTVTDHAGWGLGFRQFVSDGVELINTSQGGRSSMSFIREGRWERALALKGAYYLIQFGHNDQPGKPGRSTTLDEYRMYMNRYVDEARAIGAVPVLVTPLVRRTFQKDNPHRIDSSLLPWARIVREIAAEKHVPLVELHDRSKELCERLGREACQGFSPKKPNGQFDGTHLNADGSVLMARLVAEELRKAVPALAGVLRDEPREAHPKADEEGIDAVVSFDGSGNYATIQAAIDAAPAGRTRPWVILVKPGVYHGHVVVPENKPFLCLRGEEGPEATVVTDGLNLGTAGPDGRRIGAARSVTVYVRGGNFRAENLTFENSTPRGQHVQALALFVDADRAVFRRCRMIGWQDTLRADGPRGQLARQYYCDCYIEGHVDFIYGAATAVFSRCEIHCKADGFITAASTPEGHRFGYVFLDCRVTAGAGVKRGVYLGRPWRPHAAVAFIRTSLPGQVHPEGWSNWRNPANEKTARYAEYGSTGPGARPASRAAWARVLTDEEARACTLSAVLSGPDGWNPEK